MQNRDKTGDLGWEVGFIGVAGTLCRFGSGNLERMEDVQPCSARDSLCGMLASTGKRVVLLMDFTSRV